MKTLPRIKTFLWRCAHNSIGVKESLVRRAVVDKDSCPTCQGDSKLVLHALCERPGKISWCSQKRDLDTF